MEPGLRRRFLMSGERKHGARQKLLLGELFVRGRLAEANPAFLLGALLKLVKASLSWDEHCRPREIRRTAFKVPYHEPKSLPPEKVS